MAIKFTHKDKTYILDYTRETVKMMENRGFRISEIVDFPTNRIPELFYGAFLANHKHIEKSETDKIYYEMDNREELLNDLAKMYNEPVKALMSSDGEKGNSIKWERV